MKIRSLSVLVATWNRAAALELTLSHLASCAVPPGVRVEAIIVDNNSTDGTKSVVEAFAAKAPFAAHYVYEPRQGVSVARNAGLALATGDVVSILDDDAIPNPQFLQQVVDAFESRDCNGVIGGRVELWDRAHLPFTIKTDMVPQQLRAVDHPAGFIHGCNMSLHRDVLTRLGGFDERFGAGTRLMSTEDTELFVRAFRAGFDVHYAPEILVFHNHGRTAAGDIAKLLRGYYIGTGALFARHGLHGPRSLGRVFYWDVRFSLGVFLGRHKGEDPRWHLRKLWYYTLGFFRYLRVAGRPVRREQPAVSAVAPPLTAERPKL